MSRIIIWILIFCHTPLNGPHCEKRVYIICGTQAWCNSVVIIIILLWCTKERYCYLKSIVLRLLLTFRHVFLKYVYCMTKYILWRAAWVRDNNFICTSLCLLRIKLNELHFPFAYCVCTVAVVVVLNIICCQYLLWLTIVLVILSGRVMSDLSIGQVSFA